MNFLYCLDKNYNIQAFVSIYSLLENVSTKINIFMIHKDPKTFKKYKKKLFRHKNLNELKIYQFNSYANFPNLENAHISEATYYRLYIDDYIDQDIESLIYLDADTVIVNHISEEFYKIMEDLINSDYSIAVKKESVNTEHTKNIKMKSEKYFNAGVMFIDYKKWIGNNISSKLQLRQEEIKKVIKFWDQDVLNSLFDGDYQELNEINNYKVDVDDRSQPMITPHVNVVHYMGKSKPWTVRGVVNKNSIHYQGIYKKVFYLPYHISTNWKQQAYGDLKTIIKNKREFEIKNRLGLILSVLYFLVKKRG